MITALTKYNREIYNREMKVAENAPFYRKKK